MSQEKLFAEFSPITTEAWEKVIEADLKGADRTKKLVWSTYEGINIEPYYRLEHMKGLEYLTSQLPGEYPYVRGNNYGQNIWEVRLDITEPNVTTANEYALHNLERGVQGIGFVSVITNGKLQGIAVQTQADFDALLQGIDLETTAVHFDFGNRAHKVMEWLLQYCKTNSVDISLVKGSIAFDPITALAISGSSASKQEMLEQVNVLVVGASQLPQMRVLQVDTRPYQLSGSNIVQELAIALSLGAEYVNTLKDAGLPSDQIASVLGFTFSISGSYFLEIARLRVFRKLWAEVMESFGFSGDALKTKVHCETSMWNKTIYDPNVNMLRATTEAMSAIIAGCDSLNVLPFDCTFRSPSVLGQRVARNTQIILREESKFGQIVDPSAGSFYIENITDSLADSTTAYFLELESNGGVLEALQSGSLQNAIASVRAKREKAVAQRRESFLGTNQYPNLTETMITDINIPEPLLVQEQQASDIQVEPLVLKRGSEVFEQLRLRTEKSGKVPKVFLYTAGKVAFRRARASFITGFFGCAGFEIQDNNGFDSLQAGMQAVKESNPDIVVLCSSDDEYVDLAKELFPALAEYKPNLLKVVAGSPAAMDELTALGADDFVHLKTNIIESLTNYQNKLGVQ
jgi:methylmalonyl-CoA mutase